MITQNFNFLVILLNFTQDQQEENKVEEEYQEDDLTSDDLPRIQQEVNDLLT